MKRSILFLTTLLTFLFLQTAFSQVRYNGWWQSNLYIFEDLQENRFWNYYQGLQFRLSPENNEDLYLNTFLRVAYRADLKEWEERVYNLYGNWNLGQNYQVRLGRQFLYRGVINGTMDAVTLSGRFARNLQLSAVVGTEAPYNRELKITRWNEGGAVGGFASYRMPWNNSLEVSYFQKTRKPELTDQEADTSSELYWQQLGTTLVGYFNKRLNYYVRFDYNLLKDSYQTLRGRLMYIQDRWLLSLEYNSQRPRIYEDSFFNIFKVYAHNQIRGAFQYRLKEYDLGVQFIHTAYDVSDFYILFKDKKDNNDVRLVGSIGHNKYGTLGVIYQTGFGGENIGYFADLRYSILSNLTFRLFNSYYNYERATTNVGEDALAFMAGLGYRLNERLMLDGELQQSSNNLYKNDLRGLLRFTYILGN
jgi:hypothetical protein